MSYLDYKIEQRNKLMKEVLESFETYKKRVEKNRHRFDGTRFERDYEHHKKEDK